MAKLYVHALKSIKRDFQGIPMVIAFQPHMHFPPQYVGYYDYLTETATRKLKNYINEKWHFFKVEDEFREKGFLNPNYIGVVHMTNNGHRAASEYLCKQLVPIINEIRAVP